MRSLIALSTLGVAALGAAGCEQLGLGPQRAASAPTPVVETQVLDLTPYAGKTYAQFVSEPGMDRYAVTALGLSAAEQARFAHAMATERAAPVLAGGGVEALVFAGCAENGCLEGLAVVAIDTATGETFVGVSDMAGAVKPVPNDRLEALLRLTSPSQSWDDPAQAQTTPTVAAAP